MVESMAGKTFPKLVSYNTNLGRGLVNHWLKGGSREVK